MDFLFKDLKAEMQLAFAQKEAELELRQK